MNPKYSGETCRGAEPAAPANDGERWRPFPTAWYADKYEVSDQGRIRKTGGRVLKQTPSNLGYMRVRLGDPRSQARVHRMVALAFLPNPLGKPSVNHIDHDRANNRLANLEWCTQAENLAHMTAAGRRSRPWAGKRSPTALVSDEGVCAIRAERASTGASFAALARTHGLSKRAIGRLINRETYRDV